MSFVAIDMRRTHVQRQLKKPSATSTNHAHVTVNILNHMLNQNFLFISKSICSHRNIMHVDAAYDQEKRRKYIYGPVYKDILEIGFQILDKPKYLHVFF